MTPEEEELERKLGLHAEEDHTGEASAYAENIEESVSEIDEAGEAGEPGEPEALMSPEEVSRMERLKDWSEELSKRLGGGMSVNSNGVFTVPSTATEKDIGRALLMMNDAELNSGNMSVVLKLGIAEMIIQIAAREEKDYVEVIDEYGICEGYGREINTIYSWIRVVQEVPKSCFKYGLSMSHYIAAASVKSPEDPADKKAFYKKKVSILARAGKDPKAIGSRQVGREIREAATASKSKSKPAPKRESVGSILRRLNDCHRAKDATDPGADPSGALLKSLGVTRADIINQIEADEGELIIREEIADDVSKIVFHWAPDDSEDEASEPKRPPVVDAEIEGEEVQE